MIEREGDFTLEVISLPLILPYFKHQRYMYQTGLTKITCMSPGGYKTATESPLHLLGSS